MNLILNRDGHPCREAALYLANFFGAIAKNTDNVLDFTETGVVKEPCGTVACHGGFGLWLPVTRRPSMYLYPDCFVGADKITYVMGFTNRKAYERWAYKNPERWGCAFGASMFGGGGEVAFGRKKLSYDCTLQTIADWYASVADRLEPSDNGYVAPPKYKEDEA